MGEHFDRSARVKAEDIVPGRWHIVFQYAGLGEYMEFTRNEGPCPICGGTTRFRFLDLEGSGRHYCSQCSDLKNHVGFGFRLLMRWKECSFRDAAELVKEALGIVDGAGPISAVALPPAVAKRPEKSDDVLRAEYQALWDSGFELSGSDAAGRYIRNRAPNLKKFPSGLRFHPGLPYFERLSRDEAIRTGRTMRKVGTFPGMLGYVQSHSGDLAVIWRWFLTPDGMKAPVPEAKKAAGRWLANDGAIRLFEPTDVLGTCEGTETALAVMAMHGVPCWPAVNAGGLEKFQLPQSVRVKRVLVYGDNDEAKSISAANPQGVRRGNEATKALIQRLKAEGVPAFARLPASTKYDFADINKAASLA